EIVGWVQLSPIQINQKNYLHIDIFYILPTYRNSGAAQWLFFAVKQYSGQPIIADGAISTSAEKMLIKAITNKLNNVFVLDKVTGKKQQFDGQLINDENLCYLFERVNVEMGYIGLPGSTSLDTFYMLFENF